MFHSRLIKLFIFVLITSTAVFGNQKGWWEKILPSKEPEVLKSESKTLVTPDPQVVSLQDSFAKVAEAVKPAVVNISAVQITKVSQDPEFYYGDPNEFFYRFFHGDGLPQQRPREREQRQEGTGSGVIIDKEGYILTNNHVVQGADQLTVTLIDGKSFKGKVIGLDPRTDLAVIKIKSATNFPFVPLGDSSKVRIGDWAIAVGSPFGLEQTLTVGVISAIRQSLSIEGKTFKNLLQTDAAINRGNSGGPMVNISGQLIGINTAIYAPTGVFSGIGFAIPVNDAKVVIKDLIEKGFVERSWMGVEIAPVDEVIASQFGLSDTKGALVNQVVPNSPASKAGLKRGDIVLEFDGKKIDKVQTLQDLVSAANPGRTVSIKVLRDGSSKFLKLTTAVMPKQENMSELKNNDDDSSPSESLSQVEWLGAQFSNLNNMLRQNYKIDDAIEGVLLIDLPAQCLAVEAGLLEGDVVRAVNRKEVGNVQDLKKLEKTLDEKKGFVLDVVRRGRSFYLSYKTLQ